MWIGAQRSRTNIVVDGGDKGNALEILAVQRNGVGRAAKDQQPAMLSTGEQAGERR